MSVKEQLKAFRARAEQDSTSPLDLSGTDLSSNEDFDEVLKILRDDKPSAVRLGDCGLTDAVPGDGNHAGGR